MAVREIKFSTLSPQWQEVVRRMQRLNFGHFRNFRVVDSEPELHEDFESHASFRFPGDNNPRPETYLEDFVLPAEICDFIGTLKSMGMAMVSKVQIRHGLPFQMEVEDFQ